jgi:hypothetical protein
MRRKTNKKDKGKRRLTTRVHNALWQVAKKTQLQKAAQVHNEGSQRALWAAKTRF